LSRNDTIDFAHSALEEVRGNDIRHDDITAVSEFAQRASVEKNRYPAASRDIRWDQSRPSELYISTQRNRPFTEVSPVPIAAIVALAMIDPIQSTLISGSQPASWPAIATISRDKPSIL